jgi:hypothetical protein
MTGGFVFRAVSLGAPEFTRMHRFLQIALAPAVLATIAGVADANLIINGSFEQDPSRTLKNHRA